MKSTRTDIRGKLAKSITSLYTVTMLRVSTCLLKKLDDDDDDDDDNDDDQQTSETSGGSRCT